MKRSDRRALLIAPNGFKETLSSLRVARAMAAGARRALPTDEVISFPMSDGGRGFLATLKALQPGLRRHQKTVRPPVGRRRPAFFFEDEKGAAYAEMAEVAGIHLVPEAARCPATLSSHGVGELMRAIMARPSVRDIVIGLGDTATLDGGSGILAALGVKLLNRQGEPVAPGNLGLGQAARLDLSELSPDLQAFAARGGRIVCACDVSNPLLGPSGAVYTFALQKGAKPAELPQLEANLRRWADLLEATLGRQARDLPGAGAAGGAGFALAAGLGAELVSGAQWLTSLPIFQAALTQAKAIVTGEGQLDQQSLSGKTAGFLTTLGRARNTPVIAFAGRVALAEADWRAAGFTAVYELPPHPPKQAYRVLSACVADSFARSGFGAT
ncbi:MAG: glycerate kinase [Chloracidobacterium sp. CP2_5A]|nr:MAG: glycerate kinase [Chloracidobacterium sp. CP2_5A]